jgi:uncharacterized protein with PQ loop repeat
MIPIDQILGYTATIIFSIMILPQLIKTLKTRTTKGVSILFYLMYFTGNIIAICYAILINQTPLKIKYSFALLTTGIYIVYYYKIKKEESIKKQGDVV